MPYGPTEGGPNGLPLGSPGHIEAHWQKYRPQMYAHLQREGKLEESVYQAQEQTNDRMDELLAKGIPHRH